MAEFTGQGGYAGPNHAVSSTRETWPHDGVPVEVSIFIPDAPGKLPVVVYLPGVGEDTGQGELWRRPWAQAGYAVVSIQPKAYGEALWANHQAKPGDFKAVGRAVFSRHALEERLSQVCWALEQLAARVRGGNPRYASLDLGRMALAGYDLGAQTALVLAGEKVDLALPAPPPVFTAAILISPHADPAREKAPGRYAAIQMPLLLVSGGQDQDPAAISTPASRKSLWNELPPGGKHLLWFERANHRLLSGSMSNPLYWSEVIGPIIHERGGRTSGGEPGGYDGATGATSRPGKGWFGAVTSGLDAGEMAAGYDARAGATSRGGGSGGNSGGGRPRKGGGGEPGGGGNPKNRDEENRQEEIAIQTHAARQMAIVVSVTTAFLDMSLKDSQEAREWLLDAAPAWFKEHATGLRK